MVVQGFYPQPLRNLVLVHVNWAYGIVAGVPYPLASYILLELHIVSFASLIMFGQWWHTRGLTVAKRRGYQKGLIHVVGGEMED